MSHTCLCWLVRLPILSCIDNYFYEEVFFQYWYEKYRLTPSYNEQCEWHMEYMGPYYSFKCLWKDFFNVFIIFSYCFFYFCMPMFTKWSLSLFFLQSLGLYQSLHLNYKMKCLNYFAQTCKGPVGGGLESVKWCIFCCLPGVCMM